MNAIRFALLVIALLQLIIAAALFFQIPFVTSLWPFPGTTPLTFILFASILAASAASMGWAAFTRNYGALAGIGLDSVVILAPLALYAYLVGGGSGGYMLVIVASVAGALFGLALLVWSLRFPLDTSLPMPALVRWSFVLFIVILLAASTLLILKTPNVIPWAITPDISVTIGVMFLGAASYFAYGLFRPTWSNAAGQLAGFLTYDVILIGPLLLRFPSVAPQHVIGLVIYTIVVTYSGLLGIYFLLIHPRTRARTWLATPQPALATE